MADVRSTGSAAAVRQPTSGAADHVVLVDHHGRPTGSQPKLAAHSASTRLHLAFSAYVTRAGGDVLLTRRAETKPTWPGAWTNACCGHPQLGETLREAVVRRVQQELGLTVRRIALAVPDFVYRARMDDGTVEHELCPVVLAEVDGDVLPDPDEVDDVCWVPWVALRERAERDPGSLSPWSAAQIVELARLGDGPDQWWAEPLAGAWVDHPLLDVANLVTTVDHDDGSPVDPSADALDTVGRPLHHVLDRFLAQGAAELHELGPMLSEMVEEVRGLIDAGGKRLRPAFVYWGHRATGADHDDAVLVPAAAVELLHTFALLHDDVMDRSARRRGRATAHTALAYRHHVTGRLGDSAWFGASAAVLAGDLAYVWADELFDLTPLPASALARARDVFTLLRKEVTAGQYLDLLLATDREADEATARQVALLKSARYTVTRPLQLGAALGRPDGAAAVAPALQRYGDAVGLAFQLRDDVLGLFGDPAETGKSALDDLREGKRTLLVLRALRLADADERRLLQQILGDPDLDEDDADVVRGIVRRTGALASIEVLLDAQHAVAERALTRVPEPARSALRDLAGRAIRRRT